jgi:hypothetical protein
LEFVTGYAGQLPVCTAVKYFNDKASVGFGGSQSFRRQKRRQHREGYQNCQNLAESANVFHLFSSDFQFTSRSIE